jgi:hypothetical protein
MSGKALLRPSWMLFFDLLVVMLGKSSTTSWYFWFSLVVVWLPSSLWFAWPTSTLRTGVLLLLDVVCGLCAVFFIQQSEENRSEMWLCVVLRHVHVLLFALVLLFAVLRHLCLCIGAALNLWGS